MLSKKEQQLVHSLGQQLLTLAAFTTVAAPAVCQPSNGKGVPAAEVSTVCSLIRSYGNQLGSLANDVNDVDYVQLEVLDRSLRWRNLPAQLECYNEKLKLHGQYFGRYVYQYAISADGNLAALSGGWQFAELAGGYGRCYFKPNAVTGGWLKIGCVITAVS